MGNMGLGIVIAIIMAVVAHKKGFNPIFWFFALGPIGLVILLTLKPANAPDIDVSEQLARRKRAETIGSVLTGIFAAIVVIILSIIFYISFHRGR